MALSPRPTAEPGPQRDCVRRQSSPKHLLRETMAGRPRRWISVRFEAGIQEFELSSWRYFPDFVRDELLRFPQFIYRGQPNSTWPLESSLDRLLRVRGKSASRLVRQRHLNTFKLAARGRRGANPAKIEDDNEWWALGQHQGLATPLLDWTSSPYVAAYFAFEDPLREASAKRAVFAIDVNAIESKSIEISRNHKGDDRARVVEFVRPMQDENSRLVSQGGLFTRAPDGEDVEGWVRWAFAGERDSVVFIKVVMPGGDRPLALAALNRMNINRASLFPDLAGASAFCNMTLQVDKY